MKYEICIACNDTTGRAGKSDDSIYVGDNIGPLCEYCYGDHAAALRAAFARGAAAERASIVHGFQSGMNLYGLTPAQAIDEIDNMPLPEYRDAE